ncbi:MAG TPA: hypothetical protein VM103_02975 [Candidatus Paceibacterota bacterium]|nr:hypothetical protein [Candidatus Paceibacterota bacterium]
MLYLFTTLGTLALLGGFMAFTRFETTRGVRFFAAPRDRFDAQLNRIGFIIAHVDFAAWLRDEVRHIIERTGHAIAHLTLQVVRSVERLLTRVVKHFRTKESVREVPRESDRPFIGAMANFKAQLSIARPVHEEALHKIS